MAAQRDPGLVVDQAPLALRATLDVTAIAADNHRGRAAAVDHENRPLPFRQRLQPGRQGSGQQSPITARQLCAQVHDLDAGRCAGGPIGQQRLAIPALPRPPDTLH